MITERYRLILTHEYVDDDGEAHKIEDPICTNYAIIRDEHTPPTPVIINEMLERLRHFMLNNIG